MRKVQTIVPRVSLLALTLLAAACDDGPEDVVASYVDPDANFTTFKTFAFSAQAPNPDGGAAAVPSSVSAGLSTVDDAVRGELVERGLTQVNPDQNPDLFVVSLASTQDESALSWGCVPGYWWGYWWGYSAWSSDPCSWLNPLYDEYEVGTVGVGLVQVQSQSVAFGGVIQGVLDGSGDATESVNDDIDYLFKSYPTNQTGSSP